MDGIALWRLKCAVGLLTVVDGFMGDMDISNEDVSKAIYAVGGLKDYFSRLLSDIEALEDKEAESL